MKSYLIGKNSNNDSWCDMVTSDNFPYYKCRKCGCLESALHPVPYCYACGNGKTEERITCAVCEKDIRKIHNTNQPRKYWRLKVRKGTLSFTYGIFEKFNICSPECLKLKINDFIDKSHSDPYNNHSIDITERMVEENE